MATSKPNQNADGLDPVIAAWTKSDDAIKAAEKVVLDRKADQQALAKQVFDVLGSQPFEIGDKLYRAVHKKARKDTDGREFSEGYHIIPLPSNEPVRSFGKK